MMTAGVDLAVFDVVDLVRRGEAVVEPASDEALCGAAAEVVVVDKLLTDETDEGGDGTVLEELAATRWQSW